MDDASATDALQVPVVSPVPLNEGEGHHLVAGAPAESEGSPRRDPPEFKALRKVVEFREMDMGALCATCGLSAALTAMAAQEINPIVTHGESIITLLVMCVSAPVLSPCNSSVAATVFNRCLSIRWVRDLLRRRPTLRCVRGWAVEEEWR
jgi:hypothetical protein